MAPSLGERLQGAVQPLAAVLLVLLPAGGEVQTPPPVFAFAVAADMRHYAGPGAYDSPDYFRGAAEAVAARGGAAFLLTPGDLDPVPGVYWTVTSTLGLDEAWYPVVGNHELPGQGSEPYHGANMDWLRAYGPDPNGPGLPPDVVSTGPPACPETTFSFDYKNSHFVILNEYCGPAGDTATDGNVPDVLYDWLAADLAATGQEHLFVIGHEPAFPLPDADNGRLRHEGDSLDQYPAERDRFWALLKSAGVRAYICGHTHNYSAALIDGLWQLDAGHARGRGDTGAPSTFLLLTVVGSVVRFTAYRDVHGSTYDYDDLVHHGFLAPLRYYLPLVEKG